MINVLSYRTVGDLVFGETIAVALNVFGTYRVKRKNRSNEVVLIYDDKALTFSPVDDGFSECTFSFGAELTINGSNFCWKNTDFLELCKKDNAPMYIAGSVILLDLGISMSDVTEMDEDDTSDRAITFFRRGTFDDLVKNMKPYSWLSE